jgi:hypothetical protein
MAARFVHALGFFREPSLQPPGDVFGNLDVAAFAGLPRHAARHEGRGGSAFSARVSISLIGHGWPYSPPSSRRARMAILRRRGVQQSQSLVDGDARYRALPAAHQFPVAAGPAGNDVAIYIPTDDIYAGFTLGNDSINKALDARLGPDLIGQILDAGYNFDFIDDAAIAHGGIP